MKGRFLFAAVLALGAGSAAADCSWEWLCSGEGSCKQMPICSSVFEVPPPAPTAQPPAMPPLGMRPAKSPGPMGTLTCEHIMRQGKTGRWYWDEACFCTDPNKARDPSAPFANIIRCQAPKKE